MKKISKENARLIAGYYDMLLELREESDYEERALIKEDLYAIEDEIEEAGYDLETLEDCSSALAFFEACDIDYEEHINNGTLFFE